MRGAFTASARTRTFPAGRKSCEAGCAVGSSQSSQWHLATKLLAARSVTPHLAPPPRHGAEAGDRRRHAAPPSRATAADRRDRARPARRERRAGGRRPGRRLHPGQAQRLAPPRPLAPLAPARRQGPQASAHRLHRPALRRSPSGTAGAGGYRFDAQSQPGSGRATLEGS